MNRTMQLTQRLLGLNPYVLMEVDEAGDVSLEAHGTPEEVRGMARMMSRAARQMRRQAKAAEKASPEIVAALGVSDE